MTPHRSVNIGPEVMLGPRCKRYSVRLYRPLLLAVAIRFLIFMDQQDQLHGDVGCFTRLPWTTTDQKISCQFAFKDIHNTSYYNSICGNKCLSQGDQDLILDRIFSTIGTTNKQCVEFGFGYGAGTPNLSRESFLTDNKITSGLNTHKMIKQGWSQTFFDAEYSNMKINLRKATLTEENIAAEFEKAKIPTDVDYVSIDVDSVDIWLLNGLLQDGKYRPRVISIEYNSNWPIDMPVTCRKVWEPWTSRSRVYGTSAAAIQIVAQMYNYTIVEIMTHLDIFLISNEVLQGKCNNADTLPSFEWLGEGQIGKSVHRTCDKEEAKRRLVDFPLAFQGKGEAASAKALEYIKDLNAIRSAKGMDKFCNLS